MSGEVRFQISLGIVEGHLVALQQRMNLEPRLQPEKALHLGLSQGTRPVALHGNRLQRVAGYVPPRPCCSSAMAMPGGGR